MTAEIKYIGYYDTNFNSIENRGYSLAATNKMDYICTALNRAGYKVLIVSLSKTKCRKYFKGERTIVNENVSLKLFSTFPWGNKAQKGLSIAIGYAQLFFYLITEIKKDETILVYHSLGLKSVVRLAKKIKRFKVILEVEEIYQDVAECSEHIKRNEYKMIDSADKYIFSTELLHTRLNTLNKPHAIIYGTYKVEEDRHVEFDDNRMHVVYAGTFDPRKGGALAAVGAAEFLPDHYHVHIIGFGSKEEISNIINTISDVSNRTDAIITYDGMLQGEEYIRFLQKCDIGLSVQIPGAAYNETSFPSKILSYMSNGLRVVSVRIRVLEISAISVELFYYEEQNSKSIAEAILSVNTQKPNHCRTRVKELDIQFVLNIGKLLEDGCIQ